VISITLENRFMNSVKNLMLYTMAGVYGNNIWKMSYVLLIISTIFILCRLYILKRKIR